ncbi:HEPN domain-containing protein [Neomoorella humiferrea]|uniref:HEPN domain-containing protein n=1 Tax=Neomoorella humiferrea TaxID=676965 RepID=UPI0011B1E04F|nr:HEPN domain-containing protein [Moorella humiferrea]
MPRHRSLKESEEGFRGEARVIKEFREALKRFLVEICEFVQERDISFPQRPSGKYQVEVRDGIPSIQPIGIKPKPDLRALDTLMVGLRAWEKETFGNIMEIITRSERLSQAFLTSATGDLISGNRTMVFPKIRPIIEAYFAETNSFDFQQETFNRICDKVEEELRRLPYCSKILQCPVVGIHVSPNCSDCCLQLESDLQVRSLSLEEIEEFLEYPPFLPSFFTTVVEMKKDMEIFKQQLCFPEKDKKRIECVVIALRLLFGDRIFVPFQIERGQGILGKVLLGEQQSYSLEQRVVPPPRLLHIVDQEKYTELKELYHCISETLLERDRAKIAFSDNRSKQRVELALRKWSEGLDQVSAEWKLIAHWIALEGLFSPSSRQELSFRLALRGAIFMEEKEVYQKLKMSYEMRSRIVHGDYSPDDPQLTEIALTTEEILRRILRKILQQPRNYMPDQLEEKLLETLTK